MLRSIPVFVFALTLASLGLTGCTGQNQSGTSGQPVVYSLNTPLEVIENDPQGMTILRRDIPDILDNPKFQIFPQESIADIEQLYGPTALPQYELARVQADLGKLSAEEQANQTPGTNLQQAPPVYTTSFICNAGNTPVQDAVCASPQLAAMDVELGALYHRQLGTDSIFQRDQVMAAERQWVLGLQQQCNVTSAYADPQTQSCLVNAYQSQIGLLQNWAVITPPPAQRIAAISHYVQYKLLDNQEPALCSALNDQAALAMGPDGAIDPNQLQGAVEIAGSHGNAVGTLPGGGTVAVDLYRAGLFGGYETRARAVALGGTQILGPDSVGSYVETLPNGGGRYVSFASQTNDYGNIDVFTLQGQTVALMTDVIGYNSPAPPGEAAVAAAYTLGQDSAAPACLFETYITPAPYSISVFADQPALAALLALIDTMDSNPSPELAPSDRQDLTYMNGATRWQIFNMPDVVLDQAISGNWTGWLRARHDQVLNALFNWSQQSAANKAEFNQLFTLLRPAATELDTLYVQRQGMKPPEAEQAAAIATMELLYQSVEDIAPGLGAGPADPAQYAGYQPSYPILASPQQ